MMRNIFTPTMALTNIQIRQARPKTKPYKLFDESGLYLYIPISGNKVWRFKYRYNNKEELITIGKHSVVNLKLARAKRNEFLSQLAEGKNPAQLKRISKNPEGRTFAEAAFAWIEFKSIIGSKRCWKPTYAASVLKSLQKEAFSVIGGHTLPSITPSDVDAVIDPIVARSALDVAERTLSKINAVFRFGINKGWAINNPAQGKSEFLPTKEIQHMKYLTESQLPEFLSKLENYQGDFVCKSAVQFVLLTHVRTDEIRFSEWEEIDFEASVWSIPAERMKMNVAQTIPLSRQALTILHNLKLITGNSKYIFMSLTKTIQPISENGMLSVIYRMGYRGVTTTHGLRSTFSTIANETLKFRPDVVEASLAHKVKDPVRGAYNHATYFEERKANEQIWADYLDGLREQRLNYGSAAIQTY